MELPEVWQIANADYRSLYEFFFMFSFARIRFRKFSWQNSYRQILKIIQAMKNVMPMIASPRLSTICNQIIQSTYYDGFSTSLLKQGWIECPYLLALDLKNLNLKDKSMSQTIMFLLIFLE